MTDLETIKELLARATKGSWDNTIYCKRDGSPIKTIADIEETVSGSASYSDRLELFGVTLDDKDEDGLATVICYTGNGPNAHNNAALIAAAPDIARAYLEQCETVARLTAERNEAEDEVKLQIRNVEWCSKEILRLTAERDRLREALRKYGRHVERCGVVGECVCGLDSALGREG